MSQIKTNSNLLIECAWEVCNQVGGIYTVIRSKIPSIIPEYNDNYCLVGPHIHGNLPPEFQEITDSQIDDGAKTDIIYSVVQKLREEGVIVYYGRWLVTGRPRVVLFDLTSLNSKMDELKYLFYQNFKIAVGGGEALTYQALQFGHVLSRFFQKIDSLNSKKNRKVVAHFHEWMTGFAIPEIRKNNLNVAVVFTTHATLLGRYLATNNSSFYDQLPNYNWEYEADKFQIGTQVRVERAAAHGSHIFTTVSDITAKECEHLLGRIPDIILPNGLNIERFASSHEFQVLHGQYKKQLEKFVIGHFFNSYSFDLDKTLYFFSSGRFEHANKGFDLTLEALARLNHKLKKENSDKTVIFFLVTKRPCRSMNPHLLQSRAVMDELKSTIENINGILEEKLFRSAVSTRNTELPDLNSFIEDYWNLRYSRTMHVWKTKNLPPVVTHVLEDDATDPVLNFLRVSGLVNKPEDKVKVVYHPDFINTSNPLFSMDYSQFVRACHLGVFPSYYEPWGYTPVECMASGVASITSNLAGFGDYAEKHCPGMEKRGLYTVHRNGHSYHTSADELCDIMYEYTLQTRGSRIAQRYAAEKASEEFDWKNLIRHYRKAYAKATKLLK